MLRLSVKKGDHVYFNHTAVEVLDVTEKGVSFKVGSQDFEVTEGTGVALTPEITINVEKKSSTCIAKIGVQAPNTIAVNRDVEYETHIKKTGGVIAPPAILGWMFDWFGYTKEEALESIGGGTFTDTNLTTARYTLSLNHQVITKASLI